MNCRCFQTLLLFLFLFLSCRREQQPQNVLPVKKMTDVMWDMIRADQYVSTYLLKDSTKKKKTESEKLYDQVFHIHKITQQEFKSSLDYYSARPELFRPIIDSLAKRKTNQTPFYAPHPGQQPYVPFHPVIRDSIHKPLPGQHPPK